MCASKYVNSELVYTITCDSFKLESSNLDQKNTLVKIPVVLWAIDLDLQGKI